MKAARITSLLLCGAFLGTVSFSGTWGCGGGGATSDLAAAFPEDLAVASLTASDTSTSALQAASLLADALKRVEVGTESIEEKRDNFDDLLNAGSEAALQETLGDITDDLNIFATAPGADCYGPALNYTDHPEAGGGANDGQLPTGDLGIWEASTDDGDACVAAKLNNIIGEFENILNLGTNTVAAALGAASLDDTLSALPDAGVEVDMTAQTNELLVASEVPVTLDEATLERAAADTADGFPVFDTTVSGELAIDGDTAEFSVTMEHIPEVDMASDPTPREINAADYCGTLTESFSIPAASVNFMGNCGGSDGVTRCTRLEYCRNSTTSMSYHLRTAEFCGQNAPCGTVDPDDKKSGGNADGWGNNFYYTVCDVNPLTGAGSCAQAWQAGMGDGNTRVLDVAVDASGSGCGYFGFGPDVGTDSGVGEIDRMICNWAGPGNNHTGIAKAQRQCFTRNASGRYVSTASSLAITYAPTTSCNKLSGDATFSYDGVAGGVAVTNNLINLADVDFTMPELPVIPD